MLQEDAGYAPSTAAHSRAASAERADGSPAIHADLSTRNASPLRKADARKWPARSLAVLSVLTLAAGAWWHFFGPISLEATRPTRGPAVEAVYGSGTVEPVVMLPITPKVPGRLQRLAVDEGSTVLQGQVLAELDNRELAASVVEWEARVRYADAQFKRAQALYEKGTGTAVTLDNARNEFDTARASLDRVNRQLTEMTLTAPADGIIIRRDGEIGQLIQPGTALFWISCCGPLRISAEVDEEEIPLVRPGQKVMIRLSAFPDKVFEGAVTETTPKGDPVSRVFRVRIKLPPDTPLKIGMTADCNIVVDERSDVLLVPTSAVVGKAVWLVRDGKLLKRFVTPGVTGDRMVEVKAGLHEDDLVVVSPGKELREGGSARVRSKEP